MIAPEEAWRIVMERVRPLETCVLPLAKARGYCLAEDVKADRDLPPADRSTMDGYAVRAADLRTSPSILRLIGEIPAGGRPRPKVEPGTCARIFTGANLPPGADTIIIQEQAEERDGMVQIRSAEASGSEILRRGAVAAKGAVLLPRGTRVGAGETGVCAAAGKGNLKVYRRPAVTILCTGTELRSVEDRVRAHETRNSSGPALMAALAEWNVPGRGFTSVADRKGALTSALRRALRRSDVVLLTGGVSVGRYDLVPAAVTAVGATVRFHKISMKPGKPALYATAPGGRHIFGLPGNPVSAFTTFHEFALPALRRLGGAPLEACRPGSRLPLANGIESKCDRVRFALAKLVSGEDGLAVDVIPSESSADLASAGLADGSVILGAGARRFSAGDMVFFRPWRPLP